MFGSDFLLYTYDKDHGTRISDEVSLSVLEYDHEHWEVQYVKSLTSEEERENEGNTFCSPVASDHIEAFLDSQAAKPASKPPKLSKILDKLSVTGPSVSPDIVSKEEECHSSHDDFFSDESLVIGQMSPDTTDVKEESHSTLHDAMAKATTRAEIAALHSLLPPISTLSTSAANLHPVSIGSPLDNPFDLDVRPCESIIDRARTLFGNEKRKGSNLSGVRITGAKLFAIPPRSPDLNPIENLFNIVKRELKRQAIRKHITFETFKEFSERVKSTLYAMNTVLIDNIISSMDKRLQLTIQHKGKRTKY